MPRRRDENKTSEQVGIRISFDLRERVNKIKLMGAFRSSAESTFLAYLIEIGLAKYENIILPQEQEKPNIAILAQEEPALKQVKKGTKTRVA